ncbi:hypothetical protein HDU97_003581 [Phlyctochytrium planicorne]|nr:hypothetical protein HDU97_003581 [Phlyctochytrium planicorne]
MHTDTQQHLHRRHRLFRECHEEIASVSSSSQPDTPQTSRTTQSFIHASPTQTPSDTPKIVVNVDKDMTPLAAKNGGVGGGGDANGNTGSVRTPRTNSVIDLLLDQVEAGPGKTPMAYWHEFKRFVIQTRVLETGVGVIVGRAFQEVVRSFVNDLFVPPIAVIAGDRVVNKFLILKPGRTKGKRFKTVEEAMADGAITLNYGRFVHQSINFLAVGLSVYWFLRGLALRSFLSHLANVPAALKTFFEWRIDLHDRRPCPKCLSDIPKKAERCAFCAFDLPPEPMAIMDKEKEA